MKAKPGDVFCVWNEGLKKYTACQITGLNKKFKKEQALHLVLDWTGDEPLSESELTKLKPLYPDFMFYTGKPDLVNVPPEVPSNYIYAGNIEPLVGQDSDAYSGWDNGYTVYLQLKWLEIPKEKRDGFKAAASGGKTVMFSGKEIKESTSRIYDTDTYFDAADSLKALPCLIELVCSEWHTGLLEYVRESVFLRRLTLRGHGQSTLDFRGSRLSVLIVDLKGVREIWLNDELGCLEIIGEAPKDCLIHAKDGGASLGITFHGRTVRYDSLPKLSELHCIGLREIDLKRLHDDYPYLENLRLWGNPGYIRNFAALREFRELRGFSTSELFGFTADDIPLPEEMDKLVWLWMSSLPEDAAREVKRLYKKRKPQGLDLRIEKARKPEWLSQNLDNPFRAWDGEEHISAALAKKAAAQYKRTRKDLLSLAKKWDGESSQAAAAAVIEYAQAFNKMKFIETQEREDIYEALCLILDDSGLDKSDKDMLIYTFEKSRDF